ncbi:hypothetical protein C7964_10958 [Loktanella sp. PT4BL]|jgi:hypothetical protein|nr:hypothetical protein C7964_10958 [Loktanella sp. PT4BL]
MFTPFLLLMAAGVGFRLTLSWILRKRFGLDLAIPQALAGALLVLACLPSWLQHIPLPIPLGVALGVVLPDLLLTRRGL